MTRDELLLALAARKAKKLLLTWGDFISMLSSAPGETKTVILDSANIGDWRVFFETIASLIKAEKAAAAKKEVDQVAADDKLSIDELIEILG